MERKLAILPLTLWSKCTAVPQFTDSQGVTHISRAPTRKWLTQRRGKILDVGEEDSPPATKRQKKGKVKVESSPDADSGTDENHEEEAAGAAGVEDAAEV